MSRGVGQANIGTHRNWHGSQFALDNWSPFGRSAWNQHFNTQSYRSTSTRLTCNLKRARTLKRIHHA